MGFPPDARLARLGDLSSGWGALALGAGIFRFGEPVLAATAGLLHAIGKFGSALGRRKVALGPLPDAFRAAVLVSRVPAIAIVVSQIVVWTADPTGPRTMDFAGPGLLFLCYLIGARADLMLLRA